MGPRIDLAIPAIALALSMTAPAVTAPAMAAAPAPVVIRLIWFGRSGGISSHVGQNRAHFALYDRIGQGIDAVEPQSEGPTVYASDGRLLFSERGLRVADLRAFLAAPPLTRERVAGEWWSLISPYEVIFEYPPAKATPLLDLLRSPTRGQRPLGQLDRRQARLVRLTNARGEQVLLFEPSEIDPARPLPLDPLRWEMRFAFRAKVTPTPAEGAPPTPRLFFNVGRPVNDGARRLPVLERLRAEAEGPVLLLAAGDDVEDFSFVVTGEHDRQRPHTWDAYERLGLTALVPGAMETAFGLEPLLLEAAEHRIPLIAANLGALAETEAPLPGWRLLSAGDAKVLVIGLLDPDMDGRARVRAFGQRALDSPIDAVRRAVQQASAQLGRRPEVVVAVGVLPPRWRARLLAESGALDLLLADFDAPGVLPRAVDADLDRAEEIRFGDRFWEPAAVVPVGRARIGLADLHLERRAGRLRLVRVESRALPVSAEAPPDPEVFAAVQGTRQTFYQPAQHPLLPDLGPTILSDPALRAVFEKDGAVRASLRAGAAQPQVPGRVTAALWRQLTANLLREGLQAEIALLPPVPFPWGLVGPVTYLEAAANLNVPDEVVVLELTADQVAALSRAPALAEMTTAGLDPEGPAVVGRKLDDRERYRVVTTDSVCADPRLADLLSGGERRTFRRLGDGRYEESDEGKPFKLREVVVHAMERLGDDPEGLARRLRPAGLLREARWVADFQSMSFESSQYATYGPRDAYTEVRETRVTTASNVTLSTQGDVFLRREGTAIAWVNRGHFKFSKLTFDDGSEQEIADEVRGSTELQIDTWSLFGGGSGVPFVNVAYDTEFTPTDQNRRKRRVEGAQGLLWKDGETIKEARLAGLFARDLAEAATGNEIGFLAALRLEHPLAKVLKWHFTGEARYYLPDRDHDTASELGVVLTARTGLDVPLLGGLAFGFFLDLYGYRGKLDATHSPGASLISGLAIKYDRLWKPGYGIY